MSSQSAETVPVPACPDATSTLRDRSAVMAIVARLLAGQHYTAIAAELAISPPRLAMLLYRIELPRAWLRTRPAGADNAATLEASLEGLGYELAACAATGKLFLRSVRDRATVQFCRVVRHARHLVREIEALTAAGTTPETEETPV